MARHVVVYTYSEFGRYCRAFGEARAPDAQVQQDELAFLAVVGPPGIRKTEQIKEIIKDRCIYLEGGKVSPTELYRSLYAHRDKAVVVIDDAEKRLVS